MRVIKPGRGQEEWFAEVTCQTVGCGAVLEVELPDLYRQDGYRNDGQEYMSWVSFTCPFCLNATELTEEFVDNIYGRGMIQTEEEWLKRKESTE